MHTPIELTDNIISQIPELKTIKIEFETENFDDNVFIEFPIVPVKDNFDLNFGYQTLDLLKTNLDELTETQAGLKKLEVCLEHITKQFLAYCKENKSGLSDEQREMINQFYKLDGDTRLKSIIKYILNQYDSLYVNELVVYLQKYSDLLSEIPAYKNCLERETNFQKEVANLKREYNSRLEKIKEDIRISVNNANWNAQRREQEFNNRLETSDKITSLEDDTKLKANDIDTKYNSLNIQKDKIEITRACLDELERVFKEKNKEILEKLSLLKKKNSKK